MAQDEFQRASEKEIREFEKEMLPARFIEGDKVAPVYKHLPKLPKVGNPPLSDK